MRTAFSIAVRAVPCIVALWAMALLGGCRGGPGRGLIESLFGPPTSDVSGMLDQFPQPEARGLAMLDWIVGLGFGLAALGVVVSFVAGSIPVIGRIGAAPVRAFAAACLGTALSALVLKVLIVKYLWIVVPAILVGAALFAAIYVWGHRKQIEKFTGVDVDRDGNIGEGR